MGFADITRTWEQELKDEGFNGFQKLPVPADKVSLFWELMNEAYKAQVKNYELEHLGRIDERSVRHYSEALLRYVMKCAGHPVVAGFGASRDAAVVPEVEELIRSFAMKAVEAGLGASTGNWEKGYMGVYKRAWCDARAQFPGRAFMCDVPLMGEDANAVGQFASTSDAVSPPHATLDVRYPTIVGAPENMLTLATVGGPGTMEELSRDWLSRQMASRWLTVYTSRNGIHPPTALLDQHDNEVGWSMDYVLEKAKSDMRWGTCDPKVWEDVYIIRIGEQETPRRADNPVTVVWCESIDEASELLLKLAAVSYVRYRKSLRKAFNGN